jgi:inosine/xanthosine triphosphate pyrophosphatase family protein
MKTPFLAAMLLALSATVSLADDSNLTTKAMKDLPGTHGGTTADPTAKPNSGSLSEAQMQRQPGVNGDTTGKTTMPNAKPADGSIAGQEMEQNPGAQK